VSIFFRWCPMDDGGLRRTMLLLHACHKEAPDDDLLRRTLAALLETSDRDLVVQLLITLKRAGVRLPSLSPSGLRELRDLAIAVCALDPRAASSIEVFVAANATAGSNSSVIQDNEQEVPQAAPEPSVFSAPSFSDPADDESPQHRASEGKPRPSLPSCNWGLAQGMGPVVRTLSDAATTAGSEKRRSEVAMQMLKRTPALSGQSFALVLRLCIKADAGDFMSQVWASLTASGLLRAASPFYILQGPLLEDLRAQGLAAAVPGDNSIADVDLASFLEAASVAFRGQQAGPKFGAVLLKDGRRLAVGWNHKFGAPTHKRGQKVMHAEVHCLSQVPPEAAFDATIWIVQVDPYGAGYGSGFPCPACTQALCRLGVQTIRYSDGTRAPTLHLRHDPDAHSPTLDLARAALAVSSTT